MPEQTHDALVTGQFGPRANAYLTSRVHAEGRDLEELVEIVGARPNSRLLDLGCGAGHVAFRTAPASRAVVAVDLSQDMLSEVAREAKRRSLGNITTQQAAAEQLPFEDASFDFVVSRYSAHHWQDFEAGLREARRVLKSDGEAIFIDSVSPGPALLDTYLQTIEMLRDPSHVRSRPIAEWVHAVGEAGFVVRSVRADRLPLEFTAWVTRIQTPEAHVPAIRSLAARMAAEVRTHFAIADDGSFTLDTLFLRAGAGY